MKTLKRVIRFLILRPLESGAFLRSSARFPRFIAQWAAYRRASNERVEVADWFPCLDDATRTTTFDPHYFYQSAWAAAKIAESHTGKHVDVGSQINLIAPLTGFVDVEFVDLRPLEAQLPRLRSVEGSILALPYRDGSVWSLSSLHVIEHIGLGRYGDPIDPEGSKKACAELCRVLAPGGNLYLSVPVGRERVEFNGHRVHAPETIIRYCHGLTLVDFSCVDDTGAYRQHVSPDSCTRLSYGAGLFHFVKPVAA
jgi:hypothetical protein